MLWRPLHDALVTLILSKQLFNSYHVELAMWVLLIHPSTFFSKIDPVYVYFCALMQSDCRIVFVLIGWWLCTFSLNIIHFNGSNHFITQVTNPSWAIQETNSQTFLSEWVEFLKILLLLGLSRSSLPKQIIIYVVSTFVNNPRNWQHEVYKMHLPWVLNELH